MSRTTQTSRYPCIVGLVFLFLGLTTWCEGAEPARVPPEAMVIVDTGEGKGSAFLCSFGGTNYVVTNAHVLEGAKRFTLRTLDGRKLKPLRLELADHADLARMLVDATEMDVLPLAQKIPPIGAPIRVIGNSLGAGVITDLSGVVQGVGPDEVEVDAPFVPGNSGSPIINHAGEVVAVATYVARDQEGNWTLDGSRFSKTRRFGVRVRDQITWVRISPKRFYLQTAALGDASLFAEDIRRALAAINSRQPEHGLMQLRAELGLLNPKGSSRYHDEDYPELIDVFCDHFIKFVKASQEYGERGYPVRLHRDGYMEALKKMPGLPQSKMRKTEWATTHYRKQAAVLQDVFEEWAGSLAPLKYKNFF